VLLSRARNGRVEARTGAAPAKREFVIADVAAPLSIRLRAAYLY